jgi:hypothetical protein
MTQPVVAGVDGSARAMDAAPVGNFRDWTAVAAWAAEIAAAVGPRVPAGQG